MCVVFIVAAPEQGSLKIAYRLRRFGRTAVRKTVITNRVKVAGNMVFGWVRVCF